MRQPLASVCLLVGLAASRLSAQVPAGGEFQVNSYTPFAQQRSAVASDAAGNFVVTWESYQQDGSNKGVFAQRYDASGAPRGPEFQVNTYTTSLQGRPSVTADATGNFVVVWHDLVQDGDKSGIFAQRYDASGAPRGGEFEVNTYTSGYQQQPSVTSDAAGNFVVVWASFGQDASPWGVFAQQYDASGVPRGPEFRVNTSALNYPPVPVAASDPAGNFVVAWSSMGQDGSSWGVFAQRYEAAGAPVGGEFQVNTYTTGSQYGPAVTMDAAGNFLVAWLSDAQDGSAQGVFAQRYDASGAPRGNEFRLNTFTPSTQVQPGLATDAVGNFVATWVSFVQDGSDWGVFGQRYGGLQPAAMAADPSPSGGSDGNGVLEPGETFVAVAPTWRNVNGTAQTFDGVALAFDGPTANGISYQLTDAAASYGTLPSGDSAPCSDCYEVGIGFSGTRPATHWDATLKERIVPDAMGQTKLWTLHVGESFSDVPKTSSYYRFVETLLHKSVTGGCSSNAYCPTSTVTRDQMSVFVLAGKQGSGYVPTACGTPVFADVPASSPFCRFIEELARRGVVSGCGGGNFCPTSAVTREQMSVFLLRVLDPLLDPPPCATPVFGDVPASSPFCRWVEELARRGITGGCGGGNYCPATAVTREQMAVFITATFGLSLYGP